MTRILRHEYAAAMYFDAVPPAELVLTPPARAYQLHVHVPFCESLCPFRSFHRVQFREEKAQGRFATLNVDMIFNFARQTSLLPSPTNPLGPGCYPGPAMTSDVTLRSLATVRVHRGQIRPRVLVAHGAGARGDEMKRGSARQAYAS